MTSWLLRRSRRPSATHRLYCFPYAGGSPGVYLPWERQLPELEVWGVLSPGRGKRFDEPPIERVPALVRALLAEAEFRPPYLLFGHSLGALLAFETARALQDADRPGPVALVVSGHRPPHRPHEDQPIHRLAPTQDFRAEAERRYPRRRRSWPRTRSCWRGPMRCCARTWTLSRPTGTSPARRWHAPSRCVSGVADYWSEQDLAGWAEHTDAGCRITMVPGGHHYLLDRPHEVLAAIAARTGGAVR